MNKRLKHTATTVITCFVFAASAQIHAEADSPETPIKTIYESLALGDIKLDKAIVASAGKLEVQQVLLNSSKSTLVIPIDKTRPRPARLTGVVQYWIERLGDDATIPSFPDRVTRKGRKYAYGGSVIFPPPRSRPVGV